MDTTTKNALISAAILVEVAKGKTIDEAIDAVFGAGAYAKIAGQIQDALIAKASK